MFSRLRFSLFASVLAAAPFLTSCAAPQAETQTNVAAPAKLEITPTVAPPAMPTPTVSPTSVATDSKLESAMQVVGAALGANELQVTSADLLAKANPKGEGTLVYVQKTRFNGVERNLVWMVIGGKAYAMNGPSKETTPSLSWPRDADDKVWSKTGIDKFSGAAEAIDLVY